MNPKLLVWRTDKQFGRAIRAEREAQGLTQEKLARRAGVGRKLICQVERGDSSVCEAHAFDVIESLGYNGMLFPPKH